jgi:hypothetical protein
LKIIKINTVQLAHSYELEEIVEFGKWSAKAEGDNTCGSGNCGSKMKFEATNTIKF